MSSDRIPGPTPSLLGRRRPVERSIVAVLFLAGALSIAVTIGILWELGKESLLFFGGGEVSFWDFVTRTEWLPQAGSFGVWPLVLGTVLITVIALTVAVPIGLASAIYLLAGAHTTGLAWVAARHVLISATHTHTAPSAMGCLGTDADPSYVPYLRQKLAEAVAKLLRASGAI